VVDLAGSEAALREFLALEASGWKGRAGTALACDPGEQGFFAAACGRLAERGALQLLALRAGGRIAAMQANFVAQDGLFCFKVAFDETLGRHSPGALLEVRALDVFHERAELRWMDSCTDPGAELIERLWPDRRQMRSTLLRGCGALGRLAPAAALAVRGIRAAKREVVRAAAASGRATSSRATVRSPR
jgi:CelD/BcsL family acetyltransferase involved in cellulose biosynthesis